VRSSLLDRLYGVPAATLAEGGDRRAPVEFAIAKLALLPPGDGAAVLLQVGGAARLTATHRVFVERAVSALHLKYNGKPSQPRTTTKDTAAAHSPAPRTSMHCVTRSSRSFFP
jgi:hypothetical protein